MNLKSTPKTIFILAGETSGDLHGSQLMQALKAYGPSVHFFGVGGPLMRQQGMKICFEMEQLKVMGLVDVIKSLPSLAFKFFTLLEVIIKQNPAIVILIDYPGFNLRLAKHLRKRGYSGKIVQYISPTVWAHGPTRVETIEKNYDLLLTIYPFEKNFYNQAKLKVAYIGNPLTQKSISYQTANWPSIGGLHGKKSYLALFPGSRESEILAHWPIQLKAAAQLLKKHPQLKFVCLMSDDKDFHTLADIAANSTLTLNQNLFLASSSLKKEVIANCELALAKSGTICLELALNNRPTIVIYEVSKINYLFAKYILKLKLKHYCIVNILANRSLFPEFIGHKIDERAISQALINLYEEFEPKSDMITGCEEIKKILGQKDASKEAAKMIWEL